MSLAIRKRVCSLLPIIAASAAVLSTVPAIASESFAERVRATRPQHSGKLTVTGLRAPVEIIRDRWGIAHIYAKNTHDLFFAQGFSAAQDHMWSIELWRRNAEGKLAEVLGPQYLERDKFARITKYRGDWGAEFRKYHPEGPTIFAAFATGVNAAISQAVAQNKVPMEFELSRFRPQPVWTAQTVLSRMAVWPITRNADSELTRAMVVKTMGLAKAQELMLTDPPVELVWPEGLDPADINADIMNIARGANAFDFTFQSPMAGTSKVSSTDMRSEETPVAMGSNNWVVGGKKSITGMPLLANDPHREVRNPALRYWVHLVAPGWNAIGATEPGLPGITIGHNERVGWGLTILNGDQLDLYVEQTEADHPNCYRFRGDWRSMKVDLEEIAIKGAGIQRFEVRTTIHGPVVYEDPARQRAYAMRWSGFEVGGHGYLGSLNLMQANSWDDFTARAARSWYAQHSLVYADVDGNYGYLATGLTPVRPNWHGLLPVPGHEGKYEWAGYTPTDQLPRSLNDAAGFYGSANNNVFPSIFPGQKVPPFSFEYGAPFRYQRIVELLSEDKKFSINDLQQMQGDVLSIPARHLVPLLKSVQVDQPDLRAAITQLLSWDYQIKADSIAAAIYEYWFLKLAPLVYAKKLPLTAHTFNRYDPSRVIQWLEQPDAAFGSDPQAERDRVLVTALDQALENLRHLAGNDPAKWVWGRIHQSRFVHPLANAENAAVLHIPPVPRGGDIFTLQLTGGPGEKEADQSVGASVMFVFDVQDWDRSVGLNAPGNESHIGSIHYADLAAAWGRNEPFTLAFSKRKVRSVALDTMILQP